MEDMISSRDIALKFAVTPTTAKRWIKNFKLKTFRPSKRGVIFVNKDDFLQKMKEAGDANSK